MASTPFFLSPPAPKGAQVTYKVHPLVVFNILDHYRRYFPNFPDNLGRNSSSQTPVFGFPVRRSEFNVFIEVRATSCPKIRRNARKREPKQHRVVGTLLGETVKTVDGVKIHIKNSFPIPHADFKGDE
eukprot:1104928-Amorphochlora_amoeboformis.AAC.1